MQADLKTTSRTIRIRNEDSSPQLLFDKVQLITAVRNVTVTLLFVALSVFLFRTFASGSPLFWPLLKATGVLTMVASVAFLSHNTKTNRR